MKKDQVLKFCWFYTGTSTCPYERGSQNARLWQAEKFCCDYPDIIDDKGPVASMREAIYSYVGKWDPYHAEELMRYYVSTCQEHPK